MNEAKRLQELKDRISQLDGERKFLDEHLKTILAEMEDMGVSPDTIEKEINKSERIIAKLTGEITEKLEEAQAKLDGDEED